MTRDVEHFRVREPQRLEPAWGQRVDDPGELARRRACGCVPQPPLPSGGQRDVVVVGKSIGESPLTTRAARCSSTAITVSVRGSGRTLRPGPLVSRRPMARPSSAKPG